MAATLVFTRNPQVFALHGHIQVRYSTMVVVKGSKIAGVNIVPEREADASAIKVPTGSLSFTFASDSGTVKEVTRYTIMEHWADAHEKKVKGHMQTYMVGYISIMPRAEAYPITLQIGNKAVAKLRKDGKCYRLHKTTRPKEDAILIHEAPNAGWLTGCISPRKLDDQKSYTDSSHTAFNELVDIVGKEGDLFVLNW